MKKKILIGLALFWSTFLLLWCSVWDFDMNGSFYILRDINGVPTVFAYPMKNGVAQSQYSITLNSNSYNSIVISFKIFLLVIVLLKNV